MSQSAILSSLDEARQAINDLSLQEHSTRQIERFSNELYNRLYDGKKALICGNGGSMAEAMHFAEEFTGRFHKDRRPYPVIAISDPTYLSCTANDFGYAYTFSRMVEAVGQEGDMLIVLSTSGESENVLMAIESAKQLGMFVIGLLGLSGGRAKEICDLALCMPHSNSARAQELHQVVLHTVVESVERMLGH